LHFRLAQLEAVSHVCDKHIFSKVKIQHSVPTPGEDLLQILRNISVPKNEIFLFCKYHDTLFDCDKLFEEIITDDGICYTFNMQHNFLKQKHRQEKKFQWNVEKGYESNEFDIYPQRALANVDYGLSVVLKNDFTDLDYICRGPVQGFKVHIHEPDDFPQISNEFFRVPLNYGILVAVKSEILKNNVNVGTTCHTTESRQLELFEKYSQPNCEIECFSNFIFEKCECVSFLMIRKNETPICHQHQMKCLETARKEFFTLFHSENEFPCDCKPSCNQIKYDTDITAAIFDHEKVYDAYKTSSNDKFPSSTLSRINVYFKRNSFFLREATNIEKTTKFSVSRIGGIFAFFLGASLLSFIEILFLVFKNIFALMKS
jgi:acid-sensing ion channel, other